MSASPAPLESAGEPIAERRSRDFALVVDASMRAIVFALIVSVLLLFPAILLLPLLNIDLTLFSVGLFVLCSFLVLCIPGVLLQRRRWRQIGTRLLIYPDRLIYSRRHDCVTYHWAEIREFYCRAVDHYLSQFGIDRSYIESTYDYRFIHSNGHHFEFAEKLNRDKVEPLITFVETGLREHRLAAMRKQFLQGQEPLSFGALTLEIEGIRKGRAILPWTQVDYVWAEDGKIHVRKKDKLLSWCTVKMEKIPNACLFVALAKERTDKEHGDDTPASSPTV